MWSSPGMLGAEDWPSYDYEVNFESFAPGTAAVIAENKVEGESWADTLQRLLPVLAATYQQKQLLQVQVDRARQGLPPLDMSQYGAGVNVGVSPEVQRMLWIGGVVVAGLVAWSIARR
jgi:hypothetical protein